MARKSKPIVSETGGHSHGGQLPSGVVKGFDRLLAIHRPAVVAHIRDIRRRNPGASPDQLITILERRYLAAVTTGGAAVGATAVIPGVTTGITLALSGVETAGFLEATALFTQSVSEVHNIAVEDPERARALVMAMMLGREGSDLVRQLAGQVTGGVPLTAYWGELVTTSIPRAILGPLTDRLKSAFIRQFAARGGASLIGKAVPFGIGAVIGGAGNRILGRRVVTSSRLAFGHAPLIFRQELDPRVRQLTARTGVGGRMSQLGRGAVGAMPKALLRRKSSPHQALVEAVPATPNVVAAASPASPPTN
ncbi:MAG: hypothetical protein ABIX44_09995 [Cryobacterium sp.]